MKLNKLSIGEFGLKRQESKKLIIGMLNNQINNCKLEYISEWERNHLTTPQSKDKKIEILEAKKKDLEIFFNDYKSTNSLLKFDISIEIKEVKNIV
jgi:hypothetical protein